MSFPCDLQGREITLVCQIGNGHPTPEFTVTMDFLLYTFPWLLALFQARATFSVLASSLQRSVLRGVPGEAKSDWETLCSEVHQEVTSLPGQ